MKEIAIATAGQFNIPLKDLLSNSNYRVHTRPRQVAMYLGRNLAGLSYPKIARTFNRDHTTIIYACQRLEKWFDDYDRFADLIAIAAEATALARARVETEREQSQLLLAEAAKRALSARARLPSIKDIPKYGTARLPRRPAPRWLLSSYDRRAA